MSLKRLPVCLLLLLLVPLPVTASDFVRPRVGPANAEEAPNPPCPDEFFVENASDDNQTVVSSDSGGSRTVTQPPDSVFYWTDTNDGCEDFESGGIQYDCQGWPVPNTIAVCFENACTTVLDCGNLAPVLAGDDEEYDSAFGDLGRGVVITQADREAVESLHAEMKKADPAGRPVIRLYRTAEKSDEGEWDIYNNFFVSPGGPVTAWTFEDGRRILARNLRKVPSVRSVTE